MTLARFVFALILGTVALSPRAPAADDCRIDAAEFVDPALPDCGLQRAIDKAAEHRGGEVLLPAGTFRLRRGLILRDNVRLIGAGIDKTILMPARMVQRLDVAADGPDGNVVRLDEIPRQLQCGSAVVACRRYPPAWYGDPRPAVVTSIDRRAGSVALEAPYGLKEMKAGEGLLTFGVAAALERSIRKGDREIHLRSAALFRPGDELALGGPPNQSLLGQLFVKEVRGNVLLLEEPAQIDFEGWLPDEKSDEKTGEKIGNTKVNALVWALFPMLHATGVKDCFVSDLTVRGHDMQQVRPMQTRYTLAGIHIYDGRRIVLQRVAVRQWPSDGISLQAGHHAIVTECIVEDCLRNGLHPGSGLTDSSFRNNRVTGNDVGLYFCWHNRRHVVRDNQFLNNRQGGITGLGNPGDRNNVIECNRIAQNGGPGIAINGGEASGNVIRDNVIEDNSQSEPGKHPGVAIYAALEDARQYTLVGNTIRDTQAEPTQWVGIEERAGAYRGQPTVADGNVIRNNVAVGHKVADVIVTGSSTRCEANDGAKVVFRDGQR
ncbi:MAG: right-handed parallel beta-helix repeat-containing protein [Candidatus Nealsonbacteria bacterium]|nr:right-handed parallel beta-helix repeat-containing protein [Candidatus Nealsonbacteria bacterium]